MVGEGGAGVAEGVLNGVALGGETDLLRSIWAKRPCISSCCPRTSLSSLRMAVRFVLLSDAAGGVGVLSFVDDISSASVISIEGCPFFELLLVFTIYGVGRPV